MLQIVFATPRIVSSKLIISTIHDHSIGSDLRYFGSVLIRDIIGIQYPLALIISPFFVFRTPTIHSEWLVYQLDDSPHHTCEPIPDIQHISQSHYISPSLFFSLSSLLTKFLLVCVLVGWQGVLTFVLYLYGDGELMLKESRERKTNIPPSLSWLFATDMLVII